MSPKPLMSAKEFSTYTGMGINRVRKMMHDGIIPVFPSGAKGNDLVLVDEAMQRIADTAQKECARRQREAS